MGTSRVNVYQKWYRNGSLSWHKINKKCKTCLGKKYDLDMYTTTVNSCNILQSNNQ